MNQDYSELIKYLDGKFSIVEERFDNIDERFKETDKRLEAVEKRIDQLVTAIDKLTKSIEILKDEYIAIASKVDAHEKWIQQIANKLGIKLEF